MKREKLECDFYGVGSGLFSEGQIRVNKNFRVINVAPKKIVDIFTRSTEQIWT